jgi:hypothetical protein
VTRVLGKPPFVCISLGRVEAFLRTTDCTFSLWAFVTRITDFASEEGGVASRVKKREGGGGVVQGRQLLQNEICHTFAPPQPPDFQVDNQR